MQEQYQGNGSFKHEDENEGLRDESLLEITRMRMEMEAEEQRVADELGRAQAELAQLKRAEDEAAADEVEGHIAGLTEYREKIRGMLRDLGEMEQRLRQAGQE